ncbi:ligand-binding sensor domain-containing protein [Candidatus Venteria ishoeyi]|uniref:Two component regulator propeller n=1 Tax=Candidatus Venteria ishoeyi TaxID=1899563 RepID=A0A1H6F291_9GAMM|nr:two-component regulator propeller domain-containing protein [Candidatus Venteria ishoeyi]SEH04268.1 Two component regulator propeller [Candidatus Venteria ishoeyi]
MLKLLYLFVLCFSGQAFALSFEPAAPLVEVNGQIAISVQGTQGEVIWSVNKGRVEGNGNLATFFAPSEDGIATVVAIDGSGNVEKVRVTVAKGEEVAGGVSLDNTQWKLFTNTTEITSLITSDDGNTLWAGTTGGLEQRNANGGQLIRLFTILDGLSANTILTLQTDGNNGLWVGTNNGLVHLKENNSLTEYNSSNTLLPSNTITSLYRDIMGGIWIGTNKGLAYFSVNQTWQIYNPSNSQIPSDNVRVLSLDNQGGLWIGTYPYYDVTSRTWIGGGLAYLNANRAWTIYNSENSGLPGNYVVSLNIDGIGGLWAGTRYSGLAYKNSANQWIVYTSENSPIRTGDMPTSIVSNGNTIWFGLSSEGLISGGGLVLHAKETNYWDIFRKENYYIDSPSDPLINNFINALFIDAEKRLWIGTRKGLMYIKNISQTPSNPNNRAALSLAKNALPDSQINSIFPDNSGGIWVGSGENQTTGGLTNFLPPSNWKNYLVGESEREGVADAITAIHSNESTLWVGTIFGFEWLTSNGLWHYSTINTGLASNTITTILGNNSGELWVGTNTGLSYIHSSNEELDYDNRWINFTIDNSELPGNRINSLLYDQEGGLWIATSSYFDHEQQQKVGGGLAHKLSNSQWVIYNKTNSPLPTNDITSLYLDNQGDLWIGTVNISGQVTGDGAGLVKLSSQGAWQVFNTLNSGLPDNDIHNITDDGQGGYGLEQQFLIIIVAHQEKD